MFFEIKTLQSSQISEMAKNMHQVVCRRWNDKVHNLMMILLLFATYLKIHNII